MEYKNNKQQNYKNVSKVDNSIFLNKDKATPLDLETEARYNTFLDLLRSQSPIGMWKLKKISKQSYAFIKQAIRHFEFCHLIKTQDIINNFGRREKIIYVPSNSSNSLSVFEGSESSSRTPSILNEEVLE